MPVGDVEQFRLPSLIIDWDKLEHVSLIQLLTGIATKLTLRKHVTKYKNMQKWMIEFPRKFENRGIKIA